MSKHSAGPWTAAHTETTSYVKNDQQILADVRIAPEQRWEVTEANARVMAAAPDLLAACRSALADVFYDETTEHTLSFDTLEKLKAAIAKAEG